MKLLLLPIFALLSFSVSAYAANPGDVVINEIAWMGRENLPNDEWLELYNNTGGEISLGGWLLKATDGTPSITLEGTIAPGGFFLLERTDDTSVPNQQANQIYTGALGNSGEHLELFDDVGTLVDRVNAFGGWPAGDNTTKQTMERKNPHVAGSDPATWRMSTVVGGTPKAQNSVYSAQESQISDSSPAPGPTQAQQNLSEPLNLEPALEPKTQPDESEKPSIKADEDVPAPTVREAQTVYPASTFINELMPYPLGPDELEEWIEIINESDEPADISLWQIKDTLGATYIYTLPTGTIITPRGFLVLSRLTTKITLNNDGDAVQVIRPDGELVQTALYPKAERGKSYARHSGVWSWSSVPTPGNANIVPAPLEKAGTVEDIKKVTQRRESLKEPDEKHEELAPKQTASIGESAHSSLSLKATAFIATLIALISAIFIFLLKKRLARP